MGHRLAARRDALAPVQRDRVALALVVFAVLFGQVLLYPGVTDLVAALGAHAGSATGALDASAWFLGAEFVGFVLCAGLWGHLSDRTGRRTPFVVAGALGGALGYLVLVLLGRGGALAYEWLLLARFVQGAFTIGAFSLSMTMLMDLEGGHGKNMGAAGIAIGSGTALGAPVGGQLYEMGVFVPLLVAGGALGGAALLATRVADRAPSGTTTGLGDALARLRETPALSFPYAFGFMDRLTAGFFALVGTVYFRETFGLDAGSAGLVLGLFFAPFALLQYPMGVLSDRVGRKLPVAVGSLCYGAVVVAVYLAPTLALAAVAMVCLGVAGAFVSPATMALVTDLANADDRGVAMGGFNVFGNLGFLGGFAVGSAVVEAAGYGAAFLTAGLLEAGVVALALPAFLRLDLPGSPTNPK
ncbi:MFS transporter [Halarchaeum grantii]|uniref:MFS transporter n=1 Tax=Halarchaeum grantii TaxID=1193105 RepID=A0A830EYC4_9EURY|nr:MFS transporter [Halarchaeum grantii]GGL36909.1 MFS transporter [Halarchaeum grantii]